jgi:two-component system, cell cycle response regulator DivK
LRRTACGVRLASTQFTVTQPLAQEERMQISSMQHGISTRDSQIATILVAEDHLDSRDALRALLEAFGYHVLEAVNGRQAVDVALAQRPDLILMDIMMPELDGFEATRELRRHNATRATPIIAVTAMEGAHQLAIQAGANDYVRKPVDIRRLVAKVHDWLEAPLP